MADFRWDANRRLYIDSDGNPVGQTEIRKAIERSIAVSTDKTAAIVQRLRDQQLSPGDFRNIMRKEIKNSYIRQYLVGRGGRNAMEASDWGTVGSKIRTQYRYLGGFVNAIENGEVTPGQAGVRINMYMRSSRQAYEAGRGRSYGELRLPRLPGDGTTECGANCYCHWDIKEVFDDTQGVRVLSGWNCTWTLGVAEHCPTCVYRAGVWNPKFIANGQAPQVSDPDIDKQV